MYFLSLLTQDVGVVCSNLTSSTIKTLSVRKTTGNYLLRMHFPKMFLRFLSPVSATFGIGCAKHYR